MLNVDWAELGGTIFLGLVGLWLSYNYRRQVRIKLADRQVDAYMSLWKITAIAAHTRTTPLDQAERQTLYNEMTRWYHDDANGIFISVRTRNLFLAFQHNLTSRLVI
jgi:ABC-type transport system substrate-binding protein